MRNRSSRRIIRALRQAKTIVELSRMKPPSDMRVGQTPMDPNDKQSEQHRDTGERRTPFDDNQRAVQIGLDPSADTDLKNNQQKGWPPGRSGGEHHAPAQKHSNPGDKMDTSRDRVNPDLPSVEEEVARQQPSLWLFSSSSAGSKRLVVSSSKTAEILRGQNQKLAERKAKRAERSLLPEVVATASSDLPEAVSARKITARLIQAMSASYPNAPTVWWVFAHRRKAPQPTTKIKHFISEDDLRPGAQDSNELAKFFSDDARPIWAPDFLAMGYCVVFPHTYLVENLDKLLKSASEYDPKSTADSKKEMQRPAADGEGQDKTAYQRPEKPPLDNQIKTVGAGKIEADENLQRPGPNAGKLPEFTAPEKEPPRSSISKKGEDETVKDDKEEAIELYAIPVEPLYTPLPHPPTSLSPDEFWKRVRAVPGAPGPFLAPGGVRVLGPSVKLKDIRSHLKVGGLWGPKVSAPGLGESFRPGSDVKRETRTADDLHKPAGADIGYDRPTRNTSGDGKETSVGQNAQERNKSQFGQVYLTAGANVDDQREQKDKQPSVSATEMSLRQIANSLWEKSGGTRWAAPHVMHTIADLVRNRANSKAGEKR